MVQANARILSCSCTQDTATDYRQTCSVHKGLCATQRAGPVTFALSGASIAPAAWPSARTVGLTLESAARSKEAALRGEAARLSREGASAGVVLAVLATGGDTVPPLSSWLRAAARAGPKAPDCKTFCTGPAQIPQGISKIARGLIPPCILNAMLRARAKSFNC